MSGDFILFMIAALLVAGALVLARYLCTWRTIRANASPLDISLD